jgi:thiamine-monophosphate kinase
MSGEFERIAKFFKPLALEPFALGLTDDAALITPPPGMDLVVTTDTLVAGVHFFVDDPPAAIARKSLRVNLSDLAAKGADPFVYTLVLTLPSSVDDDWLAAFAAALGEDQRAYGIGLVGGDMSATPGPLSITIGAFGLVPSGAMLKRSGARGGDTLFLTGSLGDAALGLLVAKGEATTSPLHAAFLLDRYRHPQPRVSTGRRLRGLATAALDVSDGLLADAAHIGRAGRVDLVIESAALPLSAAARTLVESDFRLFDTIVTGGDDYEILFTAPESVAPALRVVAAETGIAVTAIGEVRRAEGEGSVTLLDSFGRPVELGGPGGWRHW